HPEDRPAPDDPGAVDAHRWAPDDGELFRALERNRLQVRWRQRRRRRGDLAIADRAAAGRVQDATPGGGELAGVDLPLLRCSLQQHGAGCGTGLPHREPVLWRRGADACGLLAVTLLPPLPLTDPPLAPLPVAPL